MRVQEFFDDVSDFFDNMTNTSKVIESRRELLKNLIPVNSKTAADLGCGTGADSISLGLNGLKVTGFDISGKMIDKAKLNSKKYSLNLNFFKYAINKIPSSFNNKFDTAVSLGNSLALVEEKKLGISLSRILNILKPGGIFVMQILNYTAIKKAKNRIVNISQNSQNVYVRFYDLFKMPLNFNILRFSRENPADFDLHSTELYPYDKNYLFSELNRTGFKGLKAYSSLSRDNFNKFNSKDLIIIAYKN